MINDDNNINDQLNNYKSIHEDYFISKNIYEKDIYQIKKLSFTRTTNIYFKSPLSYTNNSFDLYKIKGFFVPYEKYNNILTCKLDINIGNVTSIPFSLLINLNSKQIGSNLFIEFDHEYFLNKPFLLYRQIVTPIIVSTDYMYEIEMIYETISFDKEKYNKLLKLEKNICKFEDSFIIRNVEKKMSGSNIYLGYLTHGFYINDNLDNISNVTLTLTDEQTTEKINYDTRLLQLFAQKINNNLFYISFNNNNYKSWIMNGSVPMTNYKNIIIKIKDLTNAFIIKPVFFISFNELIYTNERISIKFPQNPIFNMF